MNLPYSSVTSYRKTTYRTSPGLRITNLTQAVDFVHERGLISFWPIKDINLPSLWMAAAGERPVPAEHDDPGHITWDWKDRMLGDRSLYYAKLLRHSGIFLSMSLAPYLYALTENYGSLEDDYLILYEQGLLSQNAKQIYEALLDNGPLDTISLKKFAHLSNLKSDAAFNSALNQLQADMKVMPVGTCEAGAWHYAYVYDISARFLPELPEKARLISPNSARAALLESYIDSNGAVDLNEIQRLFKWKPDEVQKTLQSLESQGKITYPIQMDGKPGKWAAGRFWTDKP